jgi:hypothetical protein
MSRLAVVVALVVLPLAACDKKKDTGGLPPAGKWGSGASGGGGTGGMAAGDPHAGLDMGGAAGDPHAGLDMGGGAGDPHAGLDMGGGAGAGGNPHGGAAPDPMGGRQPDPAHFLKGTLAVDAKLKNVIPPGAVLFLSVKRPDGSGNPVGMPVMAQRFEQVDMTKPFAFDLNESNSMMGNVPELTGDVWIVVHLDQDSNATTHQTGDLRGQLRTTVPQKDLKITLDTVIP